LWSSERGKATLSSRTQVLESPTLATIKWLPTKRQMFAVHPASGLVSLSSFGSSASKRSFHSTVYGSFLFSSQCVSYISCKPSGVHNYSSIFKHVYLSASL